MADVRATFYDVIVNGKSLHVSEIGDLFTDAYNEIVRLHNRLRETDRIRSDTLEDAALACERISNAALADIEAPEDMRLQSHAVARMCAAVIRALKGKNHA